MSRASAGCCQRYCHLTHQVTWGLGDVLVVLVLMIVFVAVVVVKVVIVAKMGDNSREMQNQRSKG